ncbi:oligosaccharide flippase family protein [Dendronalium sp. ChiSLP03b]|uniref:oligosaccharide flippase family protein n=1 Tax=Dendronalium sp. ChiSLP03b TaxID=3075381 RepID=UPI002AD3583E|nr:oligosaccharide flippase family protein [Dendronalium sp. ChiSLP03b]MDZ8205894.1 oligosaccharide flippase family protein [Dendronalium sp. ChiSLP03b]
MIKRWLADSIFLTTVIKNATWLLGGRVMTGFASLVYLSIVTHHLGVTGFGTLVLIQTYIQIVTDLTTFQSSQAVIRYGTICLEQKNKVALQQLLKFTTLLDLLGVLIGLAIAVILAPYIGFYMGWNQATIFQVQWCSLIILFTSVATPRGLLQLCNRFDLLALQITIPTFICMFGAFVAAILNAPVWGYLLVWFISQASGGLLLFLVGWREAWKRGMLKNINWSAIDLSQHHRGLLKFCIVSNFDSSLPMMMRQASPLVVGILTTHAAAGLFQVSYELSTPLKDLAQILTQSVYPELARLDSQDKWRLFVSLLLKSTAIATGIGAIIFIIIVCLGQIVLKYAFGEAFISAYGILVLLVAAEVFTMGNCALEPAFYAIGKPSFPLRINAIAILGVYLPLLLVLTQSFGIVGTGIATLSSTALILIFSSVLIWHQLRQRLRT